VGGIPEIVTDDVSALLVEPDDPAAMAAGMTILLRDPARAARLGRRAREVLMTRFRWEDRVKDYIDVYEGSVAADRHMAVSPPRTSSCAVP
jgi:starch synthase